MSSVSSELESFSPYSDIAETAVREHGQRLADLLAKSPDLQVQEVSQYEDEQPRRPDIERDTAPFSSNAQRPCRLQVDSSASPDAPFRIHRGKPRQRSLQPKQRKSKRPVQHRNYTAPAVPLAQNVASSHAVAVAKQTLDLYHQQGTFFSQTMLEQLLPRLDSSMALTHAASAVSSVLRFRFRPASSVRAQGQGLRDYTNALTEIRSNLRSSEPLLLAINLLCYYELVTGFDVSVLKSHAAGLHSLLLADREYWSKNTVGRTVLLGTRLLAVEACMAAGKPSPFEDDSWLEHEFPSSRLSNAIALSKCAHRIFFKLPRLAYNLKRIRAGNTDFEIICETAALAQRLLRIKDDEAYHGMLRACHVRDTLSDADRSIIPTSLEFADLADFDDFLDYSRARLTITTLCLTLPQLIPRYVVPRQKQVEEQQHKAIDAVLRCWQSCMETQRFAKSMSTTLFPLYGALKQMDSWRGVPIEEIISWLEYKSIIAFGHVKGFSGESDLVATWDMYCGGSGEKSIFKQWA
ncbi:hypothetical protein M409DRAFT_56965 [Zasmidium cellare ATCC 36951]|uniref:C6 transcription factor n=1 Tax=Zasmidium cellare ATCC 36951 TaxID=1080233 RepID=A0A6A6CCA6_ZASCE|nr:uncharacterized protein M409DRAFT_56965 [Zasmidium cellare ATCC 36951]KAF2163850.1 hypothetical protein M409DRAFT_56965 [Zasmidium cellare ATCC 36951]